eukprot:6176653-Pleurochrysis_carterae.AAC.1
MPTRGRDAQAAARAQSVQSSRVEPDGGGDDEDARPKERRRVEVEEGDGGAARDEDGEDSGERLEDVPRVLDHDGREHAAGELQRHQHPRRQVEAAEEAVALHCLPVVLEDGEQL